MDVYRAGQKTVCICGMYFVHLSPKRYRDEKRVAFRTVKHLKLLLLDSGRIEVGLRFLRFFFSRSESSSLGLAFEKKEKKKVEHERNNC